MEQFNEKEKDTRQDKCALVSCRHMKSLRMYPVWWCSIPVAQDNSRLAQHSHYHCSEVLTGRSSLQIGWEARQAVTVNAPEGFLIRLRPMALLLTEAQFGATFCSITPTPCIFVSSVILTINSVSGHVSSSRVSILMKCELLLSSRDAKRRAQV